MRTILIVDDDRYHLELLNDLFVDAGYSVVVMTNGTDAMTYFRRQRPDLIIADVAMPRYNGVEMIRDMQCHDDSVPIIIYSAFAAYKFTYMAYGADGFVLKSGDLSELNLTVGSLMVERGVVCA